MEVKKTKKTFTIFIKGTPTPYAIHVKDPDVKYIEIQKILQLPKMRTVEFEATGKIKKITILTSAISAVAIHEEVNE